MLLWDVWLVPTTACNKLSVMTVHVLLTSGQICDLWYGLLPITGRVLLLTRLILFVPCSGSTTHVLWRRPGREHNRRYAVWLNRKQNSTPLHRHVSVCFTAKSYMSKHAIDPDLVRIKHLEIYTPVSCTELHGPAVCLSQSNTWTAKELNEDLAHATSLPFISQTSLQMQSVSCCWIAGNTKPPDHAQSLLASMNPYMPKQLSTHPCHTTNTNHWCNTVSYWKGITDQSWIAVVCSTTKLREKTINSYDGVEPS